MQQVVYVAGDVRKAGEKSILKRGRVRSFGCTSLHRNNKMEQ